MVKKKRNYTEHAEQCAFIQWFKLLYPKIIVIAIPNGGSRHILEAIRLKHEGVTPGIPDTFIARPTSKYSGLFIEFKSPKKKPSKIQAAMMEKLTSAGYHCATAYSSIQAIDIVKEYLS